MFQKFGTTAGGREVERSWVAIGTGALCVLVIATPLYTAGYQNRMTWNGNLVPTTCQITAHRIAEDQCSYCCATCYRQECTTTCTGDSNNDDSAKQTCRETCDSTPYCCGTCYQVCWRAYYTKQWNVHGMTEQVELYASKSTASKTALEQQLNDTHAVGTTWTCFFDKTDPAAEATDTYYDAEIFFIMAMVFFALGGLSCSIGIFGALQWYFASTTSHATPITTTTTKREARAGATRVPRPLPV